MDDPTMLPLPGVGGGVVEKKPSVNLDLSLAWWKGFDLVGKKRVALEGEASELNKRGEESVASKRELQEEVKKFKKLSPEEKKDSTNALLLRFQGEFDALTTRAKAAEKCFLGLVKELLDAPDPAASLATAQDSLRALPRLREENARLAADVAEARAKGSGALGDAVGELEASRREVAAMEVELAKLSNQDITIRQLEARLAQIDSGIESAVAERVAARESEMRKVVEVELEAVRETETAAEGRVKSLLAQLAEMSAERDTAQAALFTARARGDEELAGKARESEELAGEVERLRTALMTANSGCDDLRRKLAGAVAANMGGEGGSSSSSSSSSTSSLPASSDPYAALRASVAAHKSRADAAEEEATRLSNSLGVLQDESKRWREVLESARAMHDTLLSDATKRYEAKEGECVALKAELSHAPSASELSSLRNQLRLLQSLHFNASGGVGGSSSGGGEGSSSSSSASHSSHHPSGSDGSGGGDPTTTDVTTVMLRRVRQLEGDFVRSEQGRNEAVSALEALRGECDKMREELEDAKALCAQLEDALAGGGYGMGGGGGLPSSSSSLPGGDHQQQQQQHTLGGGGDGGGGEDSAAAQLSTLLPGLRGDSYHHHHHHSGATAGATGGSRATGAGAGVGGHTLGGKPPHHQQPSSDFESNPGLALALRGQRDRFRTRILELEAEVHSRTGELSDANVRVRKLTEDNVALFEKIRFLQFMASGGGGGGGGSTPSMDSMERGGELRARGATSAAASAAAAAAATEDEVDSVYGKLYAEKLDPFAEYKSGERARQYAALRRTDRIVFKGSSLLLSSRYSRKALFFYAVILHLLFVYLLWYFIHSDCNQHADHFSSAPALAAAATHSLRGPPGGALS